MEVMFPLMWWSGPIGLGFFFMGLGVLLWGVSKVMAASDKDD
jgi:hypothetical protein